VDKMAQWETCEIQQLAIGEKKTGIFSKTSVWRWEAKRTTPSGVETIAKSREFEAPWKADSQIREAYQELIADLASEGWEPAAHDETGQVTLMRRQIGGARAHATTNPADLLEQLANLRAAGILTEQEFQTKKAEILKRM
jgi:hypothetical protein